MSRVIRIVAALGILVLGVGSVSADVTLSFAPITSNSPFRNAVAPQFSLVVSDAGNDSILFRLSNNVGMASSITQVYFENPESVLTVPGEITNSEGVNLGPDPNPASLPGGETIGFDTQYAAGIPHGKTNPGELKGIEAGIDAADEYVDILFKLNGVSYDDVEEMLRFQEDLTPLRVGIHVQSINGGTSDAFVTTPPVIVPAPAAMVLGGLGMGLVGFLRRRNAL